MKPLFSPKHTQDVLVFFFHRWRYMEESEVSDEEVEEKRFCFTQNANFFFSLINKN